jgi:predicted transcriptional regulator
MKEPQALFDFVRQQSFQDQALERGGYDATEAGAVRLVN